MAKKEKVKWHSKWWATGLLLPVIATFISDWINNKTFLTTLINSVQWIYNALVNVLNFEVKIWHIIVFISIAIIVIVILDKIFSNQKKTSEPVVKTEPHWLNYKKDILKRWTWSWDYHINHFSKSYEIINLMPVCPNCDIEMLEEYSNYRCPKCERNLSGSNMYQGYESKVDIHALIRHNIKTGNYDQAIAHFE